MQKPAKTSGNHYKMHFFNEISSLAVELSPLIEEKRGFCFLGMPKEQKPF